VGQPAYVDGRTGDAAKPATVRFVTVMADVPAGDAVCRLEHQQKVDVLALWREPAGSRQYVRLRAGACEGWLAADLLGDRPQPAAGAWL
jgi:hypothetical protein